MEGEPLASVTELQARLPFDMDEMEEREALGALEYLSDDARTYGRSSWSAPANTPQAVRSVILKAAIRHMKAYEGFVQSRAGDETVVWTDRGDDSGTAYFTDREINSLRRLAGAGGVISTPIFAWSESPAKYDLAKEYVDATANDKPFPFFATQDGEFGR